MGSDPPTTRIAVGEAMGPHRIMLEFFLFPSGHILSQSDWDAWVSMGTASWTHKMAFWAYPTQDCDGRPDSPAGFPDAMMITDEPVDPEAAPSNDW